MIRSDRSYLFLAGFADNNDAPPVHGTDETLRVAIFNFPGVLRAEENFAILI